MSKSNDTSKVATFEDNCPLADSELDAVTGGEICIEVPIFDRKYLI
jgi:hypothetical protein